MRLGRVRVVTALLALSLSWAAGWVVAFHLASDNHHGQGAPERAAQGLEAAIHGHLHAAGTPAHNHPLVGGVATPLPGMLVLLGPAMIGDAQAAVLAVARTSALAHRVAESRSTPQHVRLRSQNLILSLA
jgi:hypothetical protein